MTSEDGIEFGAAGASKSRNARLGRRARKEELKKEESEPAADAVAVDETMAAAESAPERDPNAPPRPSRRVGGWGEESGKRGKRSSAEEFDDERLKPSFATDGNKSDSEEDIPVIPDLEEHQDDEAAPTIALAPNIAVNRVATYRELDSDLLRHAAFLTLDNEIDLKLLTKGLSTEVDVQEVDKPWDWERLFTEVTSELLAEEAESSIVDTKTASSD